MRNGIELTKKKIIELGAGDEFLFQEKHFSLVENYDGNDMCVDLALSMVVPLDKNTTVQPIKLKFVLDEEG